MKYWARTYYEGDVCVYNHASKSFQKYLEAFTKKYFLENVGEMLNPSDFSISIPCKPVYLDETGETYASDFLLGYFGQRGFRCKLFWWHKDRSHEVKLLDEVRPNEICFRIEVREGGFESLRRDVLNRAKEKKEHFLEGYRFVVHIKDLQVDSRLRVKFKTVLTKEQISSFETYLGKAVTEFNESGNLGLIHSFRSLSCKKEIVNYKFDWGSSGKEGIEAVLAALENCDFEISKVEFSKL